MKNLKSYKTKIYVLFFLSVLLSCNLSAQADLNNLEISRCIESTITYQQVIQCESSSTFYAQLEIKPASLSELTVSYYLGGQEFTATSENGELIITDLPVGVEIILLSTNSCGAFFSLAKFNTSLQATPQEQIVVTEALAQYLEPWGEEVEGTLYDYVVGADRISHYEKVAFIQQFYYKGEPIEDRFCGDTPPPPPPAGPTDPTGSSCICSWIITSYNVAQPNGLNDVTGLVNDSFSTYEFAADGNNDVGGGGWDGKAGPAHGKYHFMDAWRRDRGVFHEDTRGDLESDNDFNSSSNYARIYYQLICEGITEPPSTCDCEKTLDVRWRYNNYLSADAKTLSGGGSKSAIAEIDEIAFVIVEQEGEETELLNGGTASARSECNESINSGLLSGLGEIYTGVGAIVLGGVMGGQSSGDISGGLANLLANGLELVAQGVANTITSAEEGFYSGSCTQANGFSTLVTGRREFTLEPNKGIEITLNVFTTSRVGGKWKYQSKTFAASEFFLGAKIPENIQTIDSDCCSPAVASYLASSWQDDPSLPEYNGLQYLQERDNFFAQETVWNNSNFDPSREWGNVVGPAPTVCTENVLVDQRFTESPDSDESILPDITTDNEGISIGKLMQFENNAPLNYILFDLSGKVLTSGNLELINHKLFISNSELFRQSNQPENGLYFLHLSDGKTQDVMKLFY